MDRRGRISRAVNTKVVSLLMLHDEVYGKVYHHKDDSSLTLVYFLNDNNDNVTEDKATQISVEIIENGQARYKFTGRIDKGEEDNKEV